MVPGQFPPIYSSKSWRKGTTYLTLHTIMANPKVHLLIGQPIKTVNKSCNYQLTNSRTGQDPKPTKVGGQLSYYLFIQCCVFEDKHLIKIVLHPIFYMSLCFILSWGYVF